MRTLVQNEGAETVKATLTTAIVDADGKKIAGHETAEQIPAGGSHEFDQTLKVPKPRRWSTEDPYLYQVVSEVRVGGRLVDRYETPLGIRTIEFTADNGFLLNGKRLQIKGVNNHHDLGCLGAAVHRRGIERQLEILKAMGCNAVRTSHNPPAPELLELCDRMGMVVMDEAFDEWIIPKSRMKYGYGRFFDEWSERDLVSMIHRDRNHPCVILWSIGNEIKEQAAAQGGAMASRLADICHREDPTRPVSSGVNKMGPATANGFVKALDVLGMNYFTGEYANQRGKLLVAAETSSALSTRGQYGLELKPDGKVAINTRANNQCVSYDLDHPGWGCTAEASLLAVGSAPWVAGEFVWTGFDYIGEPTPYGWPSRSSYFGIIDLAGFPKDRYYLYKSVWTGEPMVHVLPHWNWAGREGQAIPVFGYTNADEMELFLNGKSLGKKARFSEPVVIPVGPNVSQERKFTTKYRLQWQVPYAPGTLRAVAYKGGKQVAAEEVRTASAPARITLAPDRRTIRADGDDLSFITVRIEDKDGNLCPMADNLVRFKVEGAGRIAAVDNGNAATVEPFQADYRKAFNGLCLLIVGSNSGQPGRIRIMAASDGLRSTETAVTSTR
jgi:beta-galactosidase